MIKFELYMAQNNFYFLRRPFKCVNTIYFMFHAPLHQQWHLSSLNSGFLFHNTTRFFSRLSEHLLRQQIARKPQIAKYWTICPLQEASSRPDWSIVINENRPCEVRERWSTEQSLTNTNNLGNLKDGIGKIYTLYIP